ncbi:MAG: hypothetical protein N2255_01350 [Kiritimatiellae bacterium]|nr:hypothetical protein [Kiritimatiellia bacterium]
MDDSPAVVRTQKTTTPTATTHANLVTTRFMPVLPSAGRHSPFRLVTARFMKERCDRNVTGL